MKTVSQALNEAFINQDSQAVDKISKIVMELENELADLSQASSENQSSSSSQSTNKKLHFVGEPLSKCDPNVVFQYCLDQAPHLLKVFELVKLSDTVLVNALKKAVAQNNVALIELVAKKVSAIKSADIPAMDSQDPAVQTALKKLQAKALFAELVEKIFQRKNYKGLNLSRDADLAEFKKCHALDNSLASNHAFIREILSMQNIDLQCQVYLGDLFKLVAPNFPDLREYGGEGSAAPNVYLTPNTQDKTKDLTTFLNNIHSYYYSKGCVFDTSVLDGTSYQYEVPSLNTDVFIANQITSFKKLTLSSAILEAFKQDNLDVFRHLLTVAFTIEEKLNQQELTAFSVKSILSEFKENYFYSPECVDYLIEHHPYVLNEQEFVDKVIAMCNSAPEHFFVKTLPALVEKTKLNFSQWNQALSTTCRVHKDIRDKVFTMYCRVKKKIPDYDFCNTLKNLLSEHANSRVGISPGMEEMLPKAMKESFLAWYLNITADVLITASDLASDEETLRTRARGNLNNNPVTKLFEYFIQNNIISKQDAFYFMRSFKYEVHVTTNSRARCNYYTDVLVYLLHVYMTHYGVDEVPYKIVHHCDLNIEKYSIIHQSEIFSKLNLQKNTLVDMLQNYFTGSSSDHDRIKSGLERLQTTPGLIDGDRIHIALLLNEILYRLTKFFQRNREEVVVDLFKQIIQYETEKSKSVLQPFFVDLIKRMSGDSPMMVKPSLWQGLKEGYLAAERQVRENTKEKTPSDLATVLMSVQDPKTAVAAVSSSSSSTVQDVYSKSAVQTHEEHVKTAATSTAAMLAEFAKPEAAPAEVTLPVGPYPSAPPMEDPRVAEIENAPMPPEGDSVDLLVNAPMPPVDDEEEEVSERKALLS